MLELFKTHRHFISALLIFYFNTDVILWSGNLGLGPVMYIVQCICFLIFLKLDNRSKCNAQALYCLMLVALIVGIVHLFSSETYFYKLFLFSLLFLIIKKTELTNIQISYYQVAFFFALVSIVMYVATNYLGLGTLVPVVFEGGVGEPYATNFLYAHLTRWTSRNGGIFREPGVYQIYLNIALLFYYQINRNKIIDKISAVFLIAIFTTMSSAGIIIALCILFYQVIQQKQRSFSSLLVFAGFGIVAYISIMANFDAIFYKLMLGTDESMSSFARYYSVSIPLRMWLDYPIFGCGNAEFNDLIGHYPAANGMSLNPYLVTNSWTVIFATSGVFLGGLCFYGICKGSLRLCSQFKYPLLVIAIFLTMFSCEGQIYTIIYNLIIIIGLCSPQPFDSGKKRKPEI